LPVASRPLSVEGFVSWARGKAANDGGDIVGPTTGTELLAGEVAAMTDEARDGVGKFAEGSGEFVWSAPLEIRRWRPFATVVEDPEVVS
jgi:hypothetical protein